MSRMENLLYFFLFSFRLFNFPTQKKAPEERLKWIKLVNRQGANNKLWEPGKQSRVCSVHFKDGMPTSLNSYPTEYLGYETSERQKQIFGKKRRTLVKKSPPMKRKRRQNHQNTSTSEQIPDDDHLQAPDDDDCTSQQELSSLRLSHDDSIYDHISFSILSYYTCVMFYLMANIVCVYKLIVLSLNQRKKDNQHDMEVKYLIKCNQTLSAKVKKLNGKIKLLEKHCTCKTSVCNKILTTDKNVLFFTGIKSKTLFDKLFNYIKPLVKRKWRGPSVNSAIVRNFKKSPKKIGPKSKLSGREEFLMCLMKIRLGLLQEDLANRFNVSKTLTGRIFTTWVKSTASALKSFVFVPDMEYIVSSRPTKFKSFTKLHTIADATEIFLQTPKNHAAQRVTWSNYKHHNTAKVLISVTPNGLIAFASEAYGGSISDKQLTIDSGYLDLVDPHTEIMVDKGFNIMEECAARFINVHVPPGKRGQSQMMPKEIKKTNDVAKLRILVEQVIRRFKTFHLIAKELPITLTPNLDDIVIICAALTNLQSPIYK